MRATVHPLTRHVSVKVRLFTDLLIEHLGSEEETFAVDWQTAAARDC